MTWLLIPGENVANRRNIVIGLACAFLYGMTAGVILGYAFGRLVAQ